MDLAKQERIEMDSRPHRMISALIKQDLYQAFKAKAVAEGNTISAHLKLVLEQYLGWESKK